MFSPFSCVFCCVLLLLYFSNYIFVSLREKGLISGPSTRRTKVLLKLHRDQLRRIVRLFTGHCHLKGHLSKLELKDYPTCEKCLKKDESAIHVLCECEVTDHLRFHHIGQFFMEPSDCYDALISIVLDFIQNVGLIKG
jgi:hypothetical protein